MIVFVLHTWTGVNAKLSPDRISRVQPKFEQCYSLMKWGVEMASEFQGKPENDVSFRAWNNNAAGGYYKMVLVTADESHGLFSFRCSTLTRTSALPVLLPALPQSRRASLSMSALYFIIVVL